MTQEITAEFEDNVLDLDIEFSESLNVFSVDYDEVIEISPESILNYEGPYDVIPALNPQALETEGKMMSRDVYIDQIPIARVSNTSGGTTVIIGG